mgnify:FL=1
MVKQSLTRSWVVLFPRMLLKGLIRVYQLSFSLILGRFCRHLPSCSEYTSEAIDRHGAWAGGFMGLARICRCRPGGTDGLDFVPEVLPPEARWFRPWLYGRWSSTNPVPIRQCDGVKPDKSPDPA